MDSATTPIISRSLLLQLVSEFDGLLCVDDLPLLSLPVVADSGTGDSARMRFHFDRRRVSHLQGLLKLRRARLCFVVGPWYLDPDWIPHAPHAPTEIKLTFEASGVVKPLVRSADSILHDLQRLTSKRQELFVPDSAWAVRHLPQRYREELMSALVEFEMEVESIDVVQSMLMQKLSEEQREVLIQALDIAPTHRNAAAFMRRVWNPQN